MKWVKRVEILNGRVIDPQSSFDQVANVFIANGEVLSIGRRPAGFKASRSIDAKDKIVMPGIIDLGVRLGDRSEEYRGTLTTEEHAAVKAGITTLCCFPDTGPVIDTTSSIESMRKEQQGERLARLEIIAALTKGLDGRELSEMIGLKNAGCIGVGNACKPLKNLLVMRHALEYATSQKIKVYIHPEEHSLLGIGCAHEGSVSTRLGLPGISEAVETSAMGQYLPMIKQTGASVHFCRISSGNGQNMIRRARHDGLNVSADVSINQLFLTEMDLLDFNPLCHTRPPLRAQADRQALREALSDDSISAISSDHLPLPSDAKLDAFPDTAPGISGLETLLGLTLKLVDEKVISLTRAIELLTSGPAAIAGLERGCIKAGCVADVTIVDLDQHWICDPYAFTSAGKNSPYEGWEIPGKVTHTLIAGEVVFSQGITQRER